MTELSSRERIGRILGRKEVDRIGLFEHFWGDTHRAWVARGHIKEGESFEEHFGYDLNLAWVFSTVADMDFKPQVLEETEDTILQKDGNYAMLRRHKKHDTTPEHVDFTVKERTKWEELIKPKLKADRRRINFEAYRNAKANAAKNKRFFCWSGVNVFEMMHPVCGHEYMLMGMLEDPEWVRDMVNTYANLTVELQKILFAEEGWPDGIWYYEDMGFKERPFMSLAMYQDLIQPAHAKTIAYAHENGRPVIMHSCGFVEPLLPGMMEAGIDGLQVIEVKAGMDLLRICCDYGDRLSLIGGIDVRKLYSNDRAQIDDELERKIPTVMKKNGYVLHSDHSIPQTVSYQTYQYFVKRGMELGRY